MPVSLLMAGSRMLTADVLALTTRVERQVTIRTPRARVATSVVLIEVPQFLGGVVPAGGSCLSGGIALQRGDVLQGRPGPVDVGHGVLQLRARHRLGVATRV